MATYQESIAYKVAIAAIIGALYTVLVWLLPFISFLIWQVRIADALLPQAFLFGLPAAIGLAIGCFAGNFIGGLGPVDYIGGAIANFLAAYIGYHIEKRNNSKGFKRILRTQLAIGIQTLINVFIIGTYLSMLLSMPLEIGWLGILVGSLVAMHFVGFLIYEALRKTGLMELETETKPFQMATNFITRNFAV
jgi:uncharacterized membrane protein